MTGIITHEESQAVTLQFRARLMDFYSNDLKPCSGPVPGIHIQGDCFKAIDAGVGVGINHKRFRFAGFHPDCTFLTNAGIRWLTSVKPRVGYYWNEKYQRYINPERWSKMELAAMHFKKCYEYLVKIGCGYIENPKMHPYAMEIIGIPPTQIIHPYYFGSKQMKETHLWIIGLPDLVPDNMLVKPKKEENYQEWLAWQDCWMASPGPKRAELRSKTDPNVARVIAKQWYKYIR
jgi:hypothetical protein